MEFTLWQSGKLKWADIPAVTDNGAYGKIIGLRRLREQGKAGGSQKHERVYRKYGDPVFDLTGPAFESHPDKIEKMKAILSRWKVEIIENSDPEKAHMGYAPGLAEKKPGQIFISDNDSYGAWLHEFQHAVDDKRAHWRGMRVLEDRQLRWGIEYKGYMNEIRFVRKLDKKYYPNKNEVIRELLANMRDEKTRIFGHINEKENR